MDVTGTIIGVNPDETYTVRLDLASAPVVFAVPNLSRIALKVPDRVYLGSVSGRAWNYQILAPMGNAGSQRVGRLSMIRVVGEGQGILVSVTVGAVTQRRYTNTLGSCFTSLTGAATITALDRSASVTLPQKLVKLP